MSSHGCEHGKGHVIAEFIHITPDLWYFDCHFRAIQIMPGLSSGWTGSCSSPAQIMGWPAGKGGANALGLCEVEA